jgi:lipopolysaccharide/colanic/teichoic acid biosynthesis glycosyltransferase
MAAACVRGEQRGRNTRAMQRSALNPRPRSLAARPAAETLPTWKRTMDLALCGLALPGFALVALAVGLLMVSAAPGPLLYHQERVGRNGRRFVIHKFRTMRTDASAGDHARHVTELMRTGAPLQKLDARGDPRLIPGGWLLRATGLDEVTADSQRAGGRDECGGAAALPPLRVRGLH